MTSPTRASNSPHWLALVGWLTLVAAAGALGAVASVDAAAFYAKLQRPSWAPPAAAFGPVWTLLYALMALAAWLVWREKGAPPPRRRARALRRAARGQRAVELAVLRLAPRASWPSRTSCCSTVVVVATIAAFARLRPLAAWLMVPYLAWIAFATALCYRVWRDNPGSLG
jgi:tryptophan-rich sensory protein